jgi:hypothetical protein
LTLTTARNISSNPVTILSFYHRFDIEIMDNAYVEVSSDGGTSWNSVKYYYGIQNEWTQEVLDITELADSTTNLKIRFTVVTNRAGVADGWYVDDIKITNYMDVLTGISGNQEIPLSFSLSQNYPNPFNPSTTIKYQLPKSEFVRISLYDALGRFVRNIVNESKTAGSYDISFDGTGLASGLYIYKIEAGVFSEVKKMMLIK